MNWRQSAKAAEKVIQGLEEQIADLMHYKRMATADIKDYNECILSMISGGSPCPWCEDKAECNQESKSAGKGCSEWLLAFHQIPEEEQTRTVVSMTMEQEQLPFQINAVGGEDESERILPSGQKG